MSTNYTVAAILASSESRPFWREAATHNDREQTSLIAQTTFGRRPAERAANCNLSFWPPRPVNNCLLIHDMGGGGGGGFRLGTECAQNFLQADYFNGIQFGFFFFTWVGLGSHCNSFFKMWCWISKDISKLVCPNSSALLGCLPTKLI